MKRHHPHNRAERLALKKEHEYKDSPNKVRRRLVDTLKEQESDSELREVSYNPPAKGID